jgi:hypothetical protein
MMEWFPIETAPKDVTVLLYGAKRLGMCVGMHHSRDGWVTDATSEWATMYPPTHWMPLPPPPQSIKDDGSAPWVPHDGGELNNDFQLGMIVDVLHRDGSISPRRSIPSRMHWKHLGTGCDIVAVRLSDPPK